MSKKSADKLFEFYGLSDLKTNAEENLFSVYFYETDTAILCNSETFFNASMIKATKDQYLKNFAQAFKIVPVHIANLFKASLDLPALHNCKTSFTNEPIEFNISQKESSNNNQNALLKAALDEKNNIIIESIYSPMPEPIHFDSSGTYVSSNNPTYDF